MVELVKLLESTSVQRMAQILLKGSNAFILEPKRYKIIAASESLYELFDYPDIIGRPIKFVNHPISEVGRSLLKTLTEFHTQKKSSRWFTILKKRNRAQLELYEITDYPIFHRDTFIGCYVKFEEITFFAKKRIHQFLQLMLGENIGISQSGSSQRLSQLESEIVCLMALGKSPKEIATILESTVERKISSSSIASILNKRIYQKLEVSSVGQAIKKAILNEQLNYIPQSILEAAKEQIYFIESKYDPIVLD